ncbi:hypothetical protein [Evansella cellulosilytica]|uniref:Uncharacterized protein n=1 Tax=Evansella cellulosilytica (strain ATCC 21833 / DSM 2522 / FERM P-1141 / JCM 9156 / N-4) TaxID=649639 RepID=E6TSC9_EVAC2|nr:hypothetical protein [Evansella cellulosilytica]ADU31898.1 hypothetical protein Bcell_3657 [Evansella cellulosilytica DSM 2522]
MKKFIWLAIFIFFIASAAGLIHSSTEVSSDENNESDGTVLNELKLKDKNEEIEEAFSDNHNENMNNDIVNQYEKEFSFLEEEAVQKLGELVSSALSDYQQLREEGNALSLFSLFSTYYEEAKSIEESIDDQFFEKYDKLIEDLNENGMSTEKATYFKETFEEVKEGYMSTILDYITN